MPEVGAARLSGHMSCFAQGKDPCMGSVNEGNNKSSECFALEPQQLGKEALVDL